MHPDKQAGEYIWEKFGNSYFSEPTKGFVEENFKITKALAHKTSDEKSPKHQEFLENKKKKIAIQQAKVKHKIF